MSTLHTKMETTAESTCNVEETGTSTGTKGDNRIDRQQKTILTNITFHFH